MSSFQTLGQPFCRALPFGRLRYGEPNAVSMQSRPKHRSRSHDAVISVYDTARRKYCRKCLPSSIPGKLKKK